MTSKSCSRGNLSLMVILCLTHALACALAAQETAPVIPAAVIRTGTVTANVLNVRARPATHYEVVGQLQQGDEVQVLEENEEWYKIVAPRNVRAWIAAAFVGPDDLVTGDRVRVHSGPGLVFTTYAYLNKGDRVVRIGPPEEEWQRIEPPDGAAAWVSRAYIRMAEPLEPPDEEDDTTDAEAGDTNAAENPAAPGEEPPPETQDGMTDTGEKTEPDEAGAADTSDAGDDLADTGDGVADADKKLDGALPPLPAEDGLPPADAVADDSREGAGTEDPASAEAALLKASAVEDRVPITNVDPVIRDGVVLALPNPVAGVTTHLLALRVRHTCYPTCYLYNTKLDLKEWESLEVKLYGNETWYPGWTKPVIDVAGIQLKQDQ